MHLARAVETRAVIIYGGRELPSQSGYVANLNLASDVPCAPCWRYDDCAGNKVCMDMITPAAVINAVEEVLNSPREELAVDKVELLN
jgi:ADP-heptose:LPS heptosyltransferase